MFTWIRNILLGVVFCQAACTQQTPAAPGCRGFNQTTTVANATTTPPSDCFFFPSGMAIDPLGDLLYVGNTNGDLSFGGGTVVTVDLVRYHQAVACYQQWNGGTVVKTDCPALTCPIVAPTDGADVVAQALQSSMAADQQTYGSPRLPSDYDRCFCQPNLADPTQTDCESFPFVLSDQTVMTGNFSGPIQLVADDPPDWNSTPTPPECMTDADCPGSTCQGIDPTTNIGKCGLANIHRSLYLPVRGDPSLTYVDVARAFPSPTAGPHPGSQTPQVALSCGIPADGLGDLASCDSAHRIQNSSQVAILDPTNPNPVSLLSNQLPPEPFNLAADRGCKPGYVIPRNANGFPTRQADCQQSVTTEGVTTLVDAPEGNYHYLVMTHQTGGEISAFALAGGTGGTPLLTDILPIPGSGLPGLFPATATGQHGSFGVAPRIPGDLTQPWYVTSRLLGEVATFRLSASGLLPGTANQPLLGPLVVPGLTFNLASAYAGTGNDVRNLLFEPGGNRAFIAVYNPPTLAVLDTTPDPNVTPPGSGIPANYVTGIVDICAGSVQLQLSRILQEGPSGPFLNSQIYVSCYDAGQIGVVDPDAGLLTNTILLGGGPTTEAINYGQQPPDAPSATPPPAGTPITPPISPTDGQIDPCADPFVSDAEALRRGVTCPSGGGLRVSLFGDKTQPLPPRMYVTSYLDNAVAVVDLDPQSPTYQRVLGRIGLQLPKVQPQ